MKNLTKKLLVLTFILGSIVFAWQVKAVGAPIVLQPYATNITATSAVLNGTVNPNGASTNAWFTTPQSGSQQLFFQNIGSGTSNVSLQPYTLTGLQPGTTYSFGVTATNSYGNSYSALIYFTTSNTPPPPPPQPLPSVDLNASQTNISYGASTTLSWTSYNATSCVASGGANGWSGPKPLSGSQSSGTLFNTTTFSITCSNSTGSDSDSVTIYVASQPYNPPPVQYPSVNLTANPSSVQYNGTSTLSWTSTNATSCNATGGTNGWSGPKPTSGTFYTGNLTNTVTYTITCSNSAGSATDYVTVYVANQPAQNPTVNLIANPTNVAYGGSTTLSWTSTNATSCNASGGTSGWPGSKNTSGTFTANNLTYDVTFTITCTGNGGSATDSVFVNVGNQPAQNQPTVNLTANPTYVIAGGYTTLSWTSTFATSCTASGGTAGWAGYKPTSGTFIALINYNTTFSITCINSYGSATDSVTVYVQNQPNTQLPTVDLTANPTNVVSGGSSTLSWTSTNATSCNASGGTSGWPGSKNTSGTFYTGSLTQSTSFTLSCINSYGSASDSVTVYVDQTNNDNDDLEVTTKSATSIDERAATVNAELEDAGNENEADVWFEYSDDRDDLENEDCDNDCEETNDEEVDEGDDHSERITGLRPNTTYYFRAVARNNSGTDYGSIRSFRTNNDGIVLGTCTGVACAPQAVTTPATNIDRNSARLNGLGIVSQSAPTTGYFEFGRTFALGSSTTPTVIGSSGSNPYFASLFSLSPSTTYYFRAVVINQYGTSHGNILSFRTNASGGIVAGASTVRPVVVQTEVEKEDCSCPELVWINIETSRESIYRGEDVEYVIQYKNVTDEPLQDVIVQVMLPKELSFLGTTRGFFAEANHAVVVDIGNLAPAEDGSFSIDAMARNDAEVGKIIVTAATLAYTTVDDDTQEDVFAYVKNNIENNRVNLGGAAVFGGGFLPNSLLGWLLLLLLLLLIILAARSGYNRAPPQRVVYEEHKTTSTNSHL